MTDRYNGKGSFEEWAKEWETEDRYNFKKIEKKWQSIWDENKAYKVEIDKNKEKYYVLVEFPYPSGAGLHVGHPPSQCSTRCCGTSSAVLPYGSSLEEESDGERGAGNFSFC